MAKQFWLNKIPRDVAFYISGFVDGEGSFNVSLRKKNDYRLGWQPVLSFNVSQDERLMLDLIKKHLGCGIIKQRKHDGLYSYDVTNPTAVITKVIPFFHKYGFLSSKKKANFSIFRKIARLMEDKRHLDEEGLKQILLLREKLNEGRGRKRKYSIYDVFPKKSPETIC